MERDAAAGNRVAASPHLPGRVSAPMRGGLFATCANPHCGSGWLHLWRRREAPVFEGGWCCSSDCMAARVASALGREMDGRASAGESHRHRIPLGLVHARAGLDHAARICARRLRRRETRAADDWATGWCGMGA